MMFLKHHSLSLGWAIIILVLSSLSPPKTPKIHLFEGLDKVVHFSIYLMFSGFIFRELKKVNKINPYKLSIIIPVFYGVLMEILQHFVFRGRSFELMDIVANSLGAIFGTFCCYIVIDGRSFFKD